MHYLTVGVLCIDEVYNLASFPVEDTKVRAESRTNTRGGSAGNAATVLSKLVKEYKAEGSVQVCGAISNDGEGRFIEDDCKANGIDPGSIVWRDAGVESTPKSIVLRVHATRTIIHYRNSEEVRFSEFQAKFSQLQGQIPSGQALWVHFEGRNTQETIQMMSYAGRTAEMSLELERSRTNDEYTLLSASPRVVVFSQGFLKSFGFSDFRSFVESFLLSKGYGPQKGKALWVCTMGEKGSDFAVVTRSTIEEGKILHCPSEPATDVVDSLGAGDAFLAGLIFATGTLNLWDIDAVRFATKVAVEKIQRYGY